MALIEAILAAALALPMHRTTEPDEAYAERLGHISAAIATASEYYACRDEGTSPCWPGPPAELAGVLLELAYDESGLVLWVHKQGPRKDNGGMAISLWSLHSWTLVPIDEWRTLGGLDGTARSAMAAGRVITWARARCRSTYGAIALYATGRRCSWKGARARAWRARRLAAAIRRAE